MTQYVINIGALPNDGTGDPLRTAFNEVNLNFDQVFAAGPVLSNIRIANNTILTTNTNGNLVLAPNGVGVVQSNVNIVPNTSNIRNLGSANRRWSELYVQYANVSGGLNVVELTATGNVTVGGNLSVTGNIINVANIITDAKTIQLANTAGTANAANGSGITVGANDAIATFLFDSSNNAWATNIGVQVGGPITGTSLAVSDAIIYGNITGIDALFTGTTTTPNIVVNNISSDDSTFVTVADGLNVQGDITASTLSASGNVSGTYILGNAAFMTGLPTPYANANAVAYGETGWAGNIVPAANVTYSLGNSTLWWSNIWVAGNTIYIGGVPIGMAAGNVLTVGGNAVLQNDSNTTISTTGNITADYFFGNGSQLTGLNTSSISNGTSNVDIPTANGNITITAAGVDTWTFNTAGDLILPNNGDLNFNAGGIVQAVDEDFRIRVQDADDDGFAVIQEVDDGAGNVLGQTILKRDQFQIYYPQPNLGYNFNENGQMEIPGNIRTNDYTDASLYAVSDNDGDGSVELKVISFSGDLLGSNVRVTQSNAYISTANAAHTWTFDDTGNLTVPGNITTTLSAATGNIVGNVRTWDSAGANLYVWLDAAETPEIVELNTISGGNVDGWLVQVDGGNQALITATNPAGFFSISTNQALTGSGTLTFSSPDYEPPAPNPLLVDIGGNVWTFDNAGVLTLPNGGEIDNDGNNIEVRSTNNINFEATSDLNIYTDDGNSQWTFGSGNTLTLPGGTATIDSSDDNIELRSNNNINIETFNDVNIYTGDGAYQFYFSYNGGFVLPANGAIVGETANNNGYINWVGNSAGDGSGSTTLRLIPDDTLEGNEQYIIIDPTGGGDIHIRPGGNIDNSNGRLILGGENSAFVVEAGPNPPVKIFSDENEWTFYSNAELQAPGAISAVGNITGNFFVGDGSQLTDVNAVTVDVTDTNGLTTVYYPTFVESRTTGQLARADVDLTYRTDENLLTVGNVSVTGNVTGNYFIGNGSQLTGLPAGYANSDVANFLAAFGSNSISTTGNVTANNISGNIQITGNVTGTTANVTLIAGSYSYVFDNTGVATFPTVGGDEGGEINFGIPAANTTLTGPVKVDVYQDRIRFFDGSAKGAYIDLAQTGAGVSTLLNNRVSGFVNAGTYVTMDNLKATVSTGGNRSLEIATVTGSFSGYVNGTYTIYSGGTAGVGATITVTTTPALAINWNFTSAGDTVTYIITDTTNNLCYRITMMIGPSYNNNMISIERLV